MIYCAFKLQLDQNNDLYEKVIELLEKNPDVTILESRLSDDEDDVVFQLNDTME